MNQHVKFFLNSVKLIFFLLIFIANSIVAWGGDISPTISISPSSGSAYRQSEKESQSSKKLEIRMENNVNTKLKPAQNVELKGIKLEPVKNSSSKEGKKYDLTIGPVKEAKPIYPSEQVEIRYQASPQIGPVQRISPLPQEQGDRAVDVKITGPLEAKPISASEQVEIRYQASPQIGPVQRISPLPQEQGDRSVNVKITGPFEAKPITPLTKSGVTVIRAIPQIGPAQVIDSERIQRKSLDQRVKISGEIQTKISENLSPGQPQSRYTAVEGTPQPIVAEMTERVQLPIRDRVQVSENIRAWKLDESGQKTNEETTIKVIKRVMQPQEK